MKGAVKSHAATAAVASALTLFSTAITDSNDVIDLVEGLDRDAYEGVVDRLRTEEGFRAQPYSDSRGVLTIGYGTNIAEGINEAEAELLLRERLAQTASELLGSWPPLTDLPGDVQGALLDMAYQLGVDGLMTFQTFLGLVAAGRYADAADDALTTAWAEETPTRAQRVVSVLRTQSEQ